VGTTAGIQIFDSTNATEITSPSVYPIIGVSGDTAVTAHALGNLATVTPGFQASSTAITLRFNLNPNTPSALFGFCTLYGDNFELLINYALGNPGGGRRGQVVIGWNRQENGTMGVAWAYNVELLNDAAAPLSPADVKPLLSGRSGFVLDPSTLEGEGRRVTKLASD